MKSLRNAVIVAVIFGAAYAAFGLSAPRVWNSPDETAVAFFSRHLAATGRLWAWEPLSGAVSNHLHPRSIISVEGYLVPGSFYGNMLYFGGFFKLMGFAAFAVGTPLMTALAGIGVYLLMRRRSDAQRALTAEILFFALPAVAYYSCRGLFPNMLFVDLAILGLTFFFIRPWGKIVRGRGNRVLGVLIDDAAGLVALGAAFLVRPVEYLWFAPILAVLVWSRRRSLIWPRLVFGAAIAACFVAFFLITNYSLFSSPWRVGYTAGSTAPGVAIPALAADSRLPAFLSAPRPFILPFGFHPRAAFTHLVQYVGLFAWWLPVLALVGCLSARNRLLNRWIGRIWIWTALFLAVYYGSGVFADSTVSQWTVGSSYLRYFLPALVLLIPLAAEGVWKIAELAPARVRPALVGVILGAVGLLGAWTVCFRSAESLIPMRQTLVRYAEIKAAVLAATSSSDVIVTERSDKIFFPDRRVLVGLRAPATLDALPRLAPFAGLYYYGVTLSEDEYRQVGAELGERGFAIGRFRSFGNETLYGITPTE
jgi:hypothetical protein